MDLAFEGFIVGMTNRRIEKDTRGGTRTRTGRSPRDFKSLVSTIPPPERIKDK